VTRIVAILYIGLVAFGTVIAGIRAYKFLRTDVPNAQKVAALLVSWILLDFLSLGAILFLWYRDLVDESWLWIAGILFIGVYSLVLKAVERKLLTGKFSFP
jgi:hypothetical protein